MFISYLVFILYHLISKMELRAIIIINYLFKKYILLYGTSPFLCHNYLLLYKIRKTFFVSGTNNHQFNKLSNYNLDHNKFRKNVIIVTVENLQNFFNFVNETNNKSIINLQNFIKSL